MADGNDKYDRKTLIAAAALFIGFALLIFFLPNIMMGIGSQSPILSVVIVAAVLLLPFVGLWLRGRARRRNGD